MSGPDSSSGAEKIPGKRRPDSFDHESVAALAAQAALSVPEAEGNEAVEGLLHFLLVPEPVIEELPALFLPASLASRPDPAALLEIAVGGKLLYAQVRWLDDLADSVDRSPEPTGPVHGLSEALGREANGRFAAGLRGTGGEAGFFASLAGLNARYAASLAIDGACRIAAPSRLSLEDYVEHSKARAAPLRAPLDALLYLIGSAEEEARRARSCFELAAAAMQLKDDTSDVEEDHRERRLSWVVNETMRHLGDPDPPPKADDFYEATLLGGFIDRNLAAAEGLYREALALAEGHFPGCMAFLEDEAREAHAMKNELGAIVASRGGKDGDADRAS